MKRFILTLAALLAATTTHATTWARTYGGPTNDYGYCVQITSDGNYIISGARNDSLWLLKIDTLGNILWSNTYSGGTYMRGKWIEEMEDGDYIVASRDPSLIKVNASGDELWSRDYGIYTYCVQVTSDGGFIVVGGDNGNGGDSYLALVKTNPGGDTTWTRRYAVPLRNRNSGFFIRQTFDSGYIITGSTGEESEEFATKYLWLVKTNENGDTVWTKEYGTGGIGEFNEGFCVQCLNDGGYIITGRRESGEIGLWILRTDANGDTLWTKTYGSGIGEHIERTRDGGYIITGGTETGYFYSTPQWSDLWLVKTDSLGDTIWTRAYGGNGEDAGFCVHQTTDTGYIVVGETSSFGAGAHDVYLLKTDSLGFVGIKEGPLSVLPANWEIITGIGVRIVLRYTDRPQGFEASIFDVTGRKVDELHSCSSSGTIVWGRGLPRGVYFIKVNEGFNRVTTAKVVLTQ